jgi:transposase
VWNAARHDGMTALTSDLKGARFALWKNPEDLSVNPQAKLLLLKEQLRQVFKLRGEAGGIALLKAWLAWASRSKIPAFVELARSLRNYRAAIEAALTHGLSNARVESVNTKIRLLQRVAFGYRDPEALIAIAMLDLRGCFPPLPGRRAA